jgi:hypothetical protein
MADHTSDMFFCLLVKTQRVFENRVLNRIFGPTRDEMTAGWQKLHKEGSIVCTVFTKIIGIITLRRLRWVGMCWYAYGRHEQCVTNFVWAA